MSPLEPSESHNADQISPPETKKLEKLFHDIKKNGNFYTTLLVIAYLSGAPAYKAFKNWINVIPNREAKTFALSLEIKNWIYRVMEDGKNLESLNSMLALKAETSKAQGIDIKIGLPPSADTSDAQTSTTLKVQKALRISLQKENDPNTDTWIKERLRNVDFLAETELRSPPQTPHENIKVQFTRDSYQAFWEDVENRYTLVGGKDAPPAYMFHNQATQTLHIVLPMPRGEGLHQKDCGRCHAQETVTPTKTTPGADPAFLLLKQDLSKETEAAASKKDAGALPLGLGIGLASLVGLNYRRQHKIKEKNRDLEAAIKEKIAIAKKAPGPVFIIAADGTMYPHNKAGTQLSNQIQTKPDSGNPMESFLFEKGDTSFLSRKEDPSKTEVDSQTVLTRIKSLAKNKTALERKIGGKWYLFRLEHLEEFNKTVAYGVDISRQKRIQEYLSRAQELTKMGSWHYELENKNWTWSDELHKVLGLSSEENAKNSAPHDFLKLVQQRDRKKLFQAYKQAIENGENTEIEYHITLPCGKVKIIHETIDVICCQTNGSPVRIDGIVRDVTELREAEESVRQTTEALTRAQEIAHLGNWSWNLDSPTIDCSEEMYSLFGIEPGQRITHRRRSRMIHPEDQDRVGTVMANITDSSDVTNESYTAFDIDYRIVRPDGEIRFVHEVGKVMCDADRSWHLEGIVHDITDRKKAELKLRNAEDRLKESSMAYITVAKDNRNISSMLNVALQKMTQYSESELSEMSVNDLMVNRGKEELEKEIKASIKKKGWWEGEKIWLRQKNGESFLCKIKIRSRDNGTEYWDIQDIRETGEFAFTDALTGLDNLRMFDLQFKLAWEKSCRNLRDKSGKVTAVVFSDTNFVKWYNERTKYKYDTGDGAIMTTAKGLTKGFIREGDTKARKGGDEFMGIAELDRGALGPFKTMLQESSRDIEINGDVFPTRVSIAALYLDDYKTPEAAKKALHKLLEEAKKAAKGSLYGIREPESVEEIANSASAFILLNKGEQQVPLVHHPGITEVQRGMFNPKETDRRKNPEISGRRHPYHTPRQSFDKPK